MADQALPAEQLPPSTRVLAELIARLLDEKLGTARGGCRIVLEYYDGHLKFLQPSPRIKPDDLRGYEGLP
jgi:hypothetical protein